MSKRQQNGKMEATETRVVIKYLNKKGLSAKEIYEDMKYTLGKDSTSYSTVKRWSADFTRGRGSVEDDPRPGRPKSSTNSEHVEKIHTMVMKDRCVTVQHLADRFGISTGSVFAVLTEVLGMSKLSARWVPRMLTKDQKMSRPQVSKELLARFQADRSDFFRRLVT